MENKAATGNFFPSSSCEGIIGKNNINTAGFFGLMTEQLRYIRHFLSAGLLAAGLLLCLTGSVFGAQPEISYEPGLDLPPGEGQLLIMRACTRCHDLKGLTAFKGYWGKVRWLAMIQTMVDHGAVLSEQEQDIVANYLAEHFGLN